MTALPSALPLDPAPALVARARAGDADALAALYQAHGEVLYRAAARLLASRDEANDVVQDLFVGLPEALARYEGRGPLEAWLRRVVVRMALMRLRAARRRPEVRGGGQEVPARGDAATRILDRLTMERALAALPDGLRAVFVLHDVEGYAHAEVAVLLGIRRNASEVRLFRARRRLRALLED